MKLVPTLFCHDFFAACFRNVHLRDVSSHHGMWLRFSPFSRRLKTLDFIGHQRKLAFLLAMASSRRPSEIASLRSGPAFMIINPESVRFLPSQLSKTDRPDHLGPPILIRRLPAFSGGDASLCPVSALEDSEFSALSHDLARLSLLFDHASVFSALYSDVFGFTAMVLPTRRRRCPSQLYAPHLRLRRFRSWRRCSRLFGSRRLDRGAIFLPSLPSSFCFGVT